MRHRRFAATAPRIHRTVRCPGRRVPQDEIGSVVHERGAVLFRCTRQRAHRERIDAKCLERPALRIVYEVERGAVDDDIRPRFSDGALDCLDVCDIEGTVRVRRDVVPGKRVQNCGAELTRRSRDEHASYLRHNRRIVLGPCVDVYRALHWSWLALLGVVVSG